MVSQWKRQNLFKSHRNLQGFEYHRGSIECSAIVSQRNLHTLFVWCMGIKNAHLIKLHTGCAAVTFLLQMNDTKHFVMFLALREYLYMTHNLGPVLFAFRFCDARSAEDWCQVRLRGARLACRRLTAARPTCSRRPSLGTARRFESTALLTVFTAFRHALALYGTKRRKLKPLDGANVGLI